jgi:DeoR/GlpR family transcriptional regulator of sugar metabolism
MADRMRYEQAFAITERLENLLALIARGTHSSSSLADRLGVSEQTVYRDILFLRERGHSIRSVRLSTSWAYQLSLEPIDSRRRKNGRRR